MEATSKSVLYESDEAPASYPYRHVIGSLMYLMIGTISDIYFAVGRLS